MISAKYDRLDRPECFRQFFKPVQPQPVPREQTCHYGAEHDPPSDGYLAPSV